jgi:hypothetical protein
VSVGSGSVTGLDYEEGGRVQWRGCGASVGEAAIRGLLAIRGERLVVGSGDVV